MGLLRVPEGSGRNRRVSGSCSAFMYSSWLLNSLMRGTSIGTTSLFRRSFFSPERTWCRNSIVTSASSGHKYWPSYIKMEMMSFLFRMWRAKSLVRTRVIVGLASLVWVRMVGGCYGSSLSSSYSWCSARLKMVLGGGVLTGVLSADCIR